MPSRVEAAAPFDDSARRASRPSLAGIIGQTHGVSQGMGEAWHAPAEPAISHGWKVAVA